MTGSQRASHVTRLHILREDRPADRQQSLCNQPMWTVRQSRAMVLEPMPAHPPAGLTWCPTCLGRLAERLDALDEVAELLARAAYPTAAPDPAGAVTEGAPE